MTWDGTLKSGKRFNSGQHVNGMFWGEIWDERGNRESKILADTMSGVCQWLEEQGEAPTAGEIVS